MNITKENLRIFLRWCTVINVGTLVWWFEMSGECFEEMGQPDNAKIFYQDVINEYPKSKAAKEAKEAHQATQAHRAPEAHQARGKSN